MTRRVGRRAGAAAAVIVAAVLATPAAPAWAVPVITVDGPRTTPPLDSATVVISGKVASDATLLNTVKRVSLAIPGVTTDPIECSAQPCPYKWTVQLNRNGPYVAKITAVEAARLIGVEGEPKTEERSFAVAAPPARPALDAPKVTDGRTVELTWSRNSEPDFLYYAVFRKDPGASEYFRVGGKIVQPASGKPSFTDATTASFSGGEYSYQVYAVRMGATGTASSEKVSDASLVRLAAVPVPPTTTTVAPLPPGVPTSAAGPTTTVKPAPPAGVDLSGFLSSRSQPITLPTITVPEPPDTGFEGTLPFGARPPSDDAEEGDADAVNPGGSRTSIISIDAGRPLVPVAGGLVLLLLALHMRILGRKVKAPADPDLPVDLTPPAPPAPSGSPPPPPLTAVTVIEPAPDPEPEPEPVSDVADDEEWSARDLDLIPESEPAQPDPVPVAVTTFNPDDIEVFEVVSSGRRRLARTGGR